MFFFFSVDQIFYRLKKEKHPEMMRRSNWAGSCGSVIRDFASAVSSMVPFRKHCSETSLYYPESEFLHLKWFKTLSSASTCSLLLKDVARLAAIKLSHFLSGVYEHSIKITDLLFQDLCGGN